MTQFQENALTDRRTEGLKDRRMDRPLFYRTLLATAAGPIHHLEKNKIDADSLKEFIKDKLILKTQQSFRSKKQKLIRLL